MPVEVKLKRKYRQSFTSPRHGYRARTGPKCCNAGCGSTRKKAKKPVRGGLAARMAA